MNIYRTQKVGEAFFGLENHVTNRNVIKLFKKTCSFDGKTEWKSRIEVATLKMKYT